MPPGGSARDANVDRSALTPEETLHEFLRQGSAPVILSDNKRMDENGSRTRKPLRECLRDALDDYQYLIRLQP